MRLYIILYCFFHHFTLLAQKEISFDCVSNYFRQKVKVCAKVADIYITKSDKYITYLDLGKAYSETTLTVVFFNMDLVNFHESPYGYYKDNIFRVTGKISKYKERLQMLVISPSNLICN